MWGKILDMAVDGIIPTDDEGRIISFDLTAMRLFGCVPIACGGTGNAMKKHGGIVRIIDHDVQAGASMQKLVESASLAAKAYASAEEFLEELDASRPGCIVLELRMPVMSGFELLQRLRQIRCSVPVIVVSGYADVPAAVNSMKLGAIDVLQKPVEPSVLLSSIRNAIQYSFAAQAQHAETDTIRARFAALTPRQRDLLRLIVVGRSNKQIATDLHLSIKTVANHRARLMAKTQASNAADLARLSTTAESFPVG
jgi:two-component system, LuxR family, response regulator FixJ